MNRYERDYPQQDELPTRRGMRDTFQDDLPLRQPAASALPSGRDREYTLSTGIVLGIFFALALICSVFFGFGYTLGRKSLQPTTSAAEGSAAEGADPSTFSKFKPAAGSASGSSSATLATPLATPTTSSAATTTYATPAQRPATNQPGNAAAPVAVAPPTSTATVASRNDSAPPAPHDTAPAPVPSAPVATGGGVTMVQIAAVSHPEDAEVLTAALKRRGYAVIARSDTGDRLIHVQVGPFPTRKDAEVMRQKLINDGYNAILK